MSDNLGLFIFFKKKQIPVLVIRQYFYCVWCVFSSLYLVNKHDQIAFHTSAQQISLTFSHPIHTQFNNIAVSIWSSLTFDSLSVILFNCCKRSVGLLLLPFTILLYYFYPRSIITSSHFECLVCFIETLVSIWPFMSPFLSFPSFLSSFLLKFSFLISDFYFKLQLFKYINNILYTSNCTMYLHCGHFWSNETYGNGFL